MQYVINPSLHSPTWINNNEWKQTRTTDVCHLRNTWVRVFFFFFQNNSLSEYFNLVVAFIQISNITHFFLFYSVFAFSKMFRILSAESGIRLSISFALINSHESQKQQFLSFFSTHSADTKRIDNIIRNFVGFRVSQSISNAGRLTYINIRYIDLD